MQTKQGKYLNRVNIEEALNAASSISNDRLQKQSKGYVSTDSFTHGSSSQRVRWFKIDLRRGNISSCNTFETDSL